MYKAIRKSVAGTGAVVLKMLLMVGGWGCGVRVSTDVLHVSVGVRVEE